MNILFYIIPIAAVLLISIIGFAVGKKKAAAYSAAPAGGAGGAAPLPLSTPGERPGKIYQADEVQQSSSHPLGAVQKTIRGRLRFIPFGLLIIGVAKLGFYTLYFTDIEFYVPREPLYMAVVTLLMAGALGWGLQLLYYATCRVKLRRQGLELCSILGKKAYAYKDIDIYMNQIIEHKSQSDGYRPVFMKTPSHNFIWVCQIVVVDESKLIVLKSSRYAWLKSKMAALIEGMEEGE